MSNILIVESKNDKIFIEALIDYLNADLTVDSPIQIDDYDCLEGLNPGKVINSLKSLQAEAQKKDISKVGLMIDLDQFSEAERLAWVNDQFFNWGDRHPDGAAISQNSSAARHCGESSR